MSRVVGVTDVRPFLVDPVHIGEPIDSGTMQYRDLIAGAFAATCARSIRPSTEIAA